MEREQYLPPAALRDARLVLSTSDPSIGPAAERRWGFNVWRAAIKIAIQTPETKKPVQDSYGQLFFRFPE